MSEARVTNVAVLDDFRVALANFAVLVRQALIDLEMESQRALDWITHDRPAYWRSEGRRSADALARAKDDLVNARTFKRVGDYVPACIEEKKQVALAKRRLEHAEQKMEAVRRWSLAAPRAVDEFRGPVQQLMAMLDGDIPRAMAVLERMSAALERYTSLEAPPAIQWEELTGEAAASTSRPADEDSTTQPAAEKEATATAQRPGVCGPTGQPMPAQATGLGTTPHENQSSPNGQRCEAFFSGVFADSLKMTAVKSCLLPFDAINLRN